MSITKKVLTVAREQKKAGYPTQTVDSLANQTGLDPASVRAALQSLSDRGLAWCFGRVRTGDRVWAVEESAISKLAGLSCGALREALQALNAGGKAWPVAGMSGRAKVWAVNEDAPPPIDERGITRKACDALAKAWAARWSVASKARVGNIASTDD